MYIPYRGTFFLAVIVDDAGFAVDVSQGQKVTNLRAKEVLRGGGEVKMEKTNKKQGNETIEKRIIPHSNAATTTAATAAAGGGGSGSNVAIVLPTYYNSDYFISYTTKVLESPYR